MIYRCNDLGILSDLQYTSLQKQISFKKWRRKEPLDDVIKFEELTLLSEAIKLLIDNDVVKVEEIIDNICMYEEEIECLCYLEKGYFISKKNSTVKPKLKIVK